jgi:hypothetical protein
LIDGSLVPAARECGAGDSSSDLCSLADREAREAAIIARMTLDPSQLSDDDTTVPVLTKNKCRTGRLWAHVGDDRPFAGKAAPAVVLYYSPNREGEHPQRQPAKYTGILQIDAYSGYNALYAEGRKPGPIIEAACWAHGRRKLYELERILGPCSWLSRYSATARTLACAHAQRTLPFSQGANGFRSSDRGGEQALQGDRAGASRHQWSWQCGLRCLSAPFFLEAPCALRPQLLELAGKLRDNVGDLAGIAMVRQ